MSELDVTALAAGGDGVARDEGGRVTFIPRAAVGDRLRVRLVKETKSFARGEIVEIVTPSADRVEPPCEYFRARCGGCAWQHVTRPAQLAAKQAIVAGALRKFEGCTIEPIADPAPPYGWRRRARFHVEGGKVGLYLLGTQQIIPIAHCPQLEPELDAALRVVTQATPPDGELMMLRGHRGEIVVSVEHGWRGAPALIGKAGIVGILAGRDAHGSATTIEIEPGLWGGPRDFAQASAAGNAALIELARKAVGKGPGKLLELYAGAGNLTRAFAADGWDVTASDVAAPRKPTDAKAFITGAADHALTKAQGPFDVIVLDPPRTGAAEAMAGVIKHAPRLIVYVSCDPATLARDAQKLVEAGYVVERAYPIDLMPQTAHVEVVLRITPSAE